MVGNGIQLTVREDGDVLLDPDVAGPHSLTNQVRIALIDWLFNPVRLVLIYLLSNQVRFQFKTCNILMSSVYRVWGWGWLMPMSALWVSPRVRWWQLTETLSPPSPSPLPGTLVQYRGEMVTVDRNTLTTISITRTRYSIGVRLWQWTGTLSPPSPSPLRGTVGVRWWQWPSGVFPEF